MFLTLYQGNNYYNRKIIRGYTPTNYLDLGFSEVITIPNIAFIVNDGIITSQVVNYDDIDSGYANGIVTPEYAVLYDENNLALSRWWVTESVQTRRGQSKLTLLRDVIADFYDDVINDASYINKGTLFSTSDPAIFNNESLTFNQIKTSINVIKDASEAAWYVGYISKETGGQTISIPTKKYKLVAEYANEEAYPYIDVYRGNKTFYGDYTDITFRLNYYNNFAQGWDEYGEPKSPTVNATSNLYTKYGAITTSDKKGFAVFAADGGKKPIYNVCQYTTAAVRESLTDWRTGSYAVTGAHTGSELQTFLSQNNQYIKIGDVIYLITITENVVSTHVDVPNDNIYAQSFKQIAIRSNELNGSDQIKVNDFSGSWSSVEFTAPSYSLNLQAQSEETIEYTLPVNRNHCKDSIYDLVCIPATTMFVEGQSGSIDRDLSRQVVDNLITAIGKDAVYDWQLLPYIPINDSLFDTVTGRRESYGKLVPERFDSVDWYDIISSADGKSHTVVVFPSKSKFEKTCSKHLITVPEDPTEFKVANECDMYRLCSPNYNGQFEFSAAKNGGVSAWEMSFQYKPYQPYIRVSPRFGRLYGRSFGDARGLICGGDFSIAQQSNAWIDYQVQNKNYQVMFDRQIENMEVNNSVQRIQERVNAVVGTVQGTVSGAMAGGLTGTPIGAAVGGVIGGVSSAVGGADYIK